MTSSESDEVPKGNISGVSVKKLKISKLKPWTTIVLVGKRNSGKTTLMREIMQLLQPEIGLVFTGTEGSYNSFASIFPEISIYDGFNEDDLTWLIKIMRRSVKSPESNPNMGLFKHAVVVIDDLAWDERVMKNKLLERIFNNGRHWHITIIGQHLSMSFQPFKNLGHLQIL